MPTKIGNQCKNCGIEIWEGTCCTKCHTDARAKRVKFGSDFSKIEPEEYEQLVEHFGVELSEFPAYEVKEMLEEIREKERNMLIRILADAIGVATSAETLKDIKDLIYEIKECYEES